MRNRALLALFTVAATIFVSGVVGLIVSGRQEPVVFASPEPSATPSPARTLQLGAEGSPEQTAADYLKAWSSGDFEAMREMVDEPPSDFVDRHRDFEDVALSRSVAFTPGEVARTGDETADVPFTESRDEPGAGAWSFTSVLHLAVRDLTWKVLWTPDVLYPGLAEDGDIVRTTEAPGSASGLLTKEGRDFPQDSDAGPYLTALAPKVPAPAGGVAAGWTIELRNPGRPAVRLVGFHPEETPQGTRTTIEWSVQAAAARALDGLGHPAALVAVRPSTGEVLAIADRLGGMGAFTQKFAPGSTFKTITAAALLGGGVTPDTQVECPAGYQIPNGRQIPNYQNEDHGTVSFRQAFALSCNTTFARLAVERLSPDALVTQAHAFGFGVQIDPGVPATCGSMNAPENHDALAEDSFGQGTVEATPLCMALVAAAVESGEWRPPALLDDAGEGSLPQTAALPSGVADGLRALMRAVTTEGTAAGAGLPDDAAGKTGTAEDWQGGEDHAWFIGYHGDLAFSVFVQHGGTGRNAAVPVAARFLRAL
ncbi:penicillin-binding transpeptidase domain-containing protein [Microbispora sp. ATCC PTA-5024]|uniref:penicillin-binding transpeptidase domain-containing protein n=1 Tax=Microbispora sp. ATCC PTA-5024 TaxID=316330 RepID=UPI0004077555|nr:penicillin-binding transpeptidase domain-containing protein [Microbispora sp. ATCC PTA-5024]